MPLAFTIYFVYKGLMFFSGQDNEMTNSDLSVKSFLSFEKHIKQKRGIKFRNAHYVQLNFPKNFF